MDLTREAPARFQMVVASATLAISAIFLFARLGHYALWDDEAMTALTAEGILQTGDTSAVLGHNIVAYRNGLLLRNMKDRATPALQFYLDAPFLAALGHNSLAARLPFAICGLATVALLLWWMRRDGASILMWLLLCLGILGNVSLFLFCRQARYYGLAMLLSVAIAYSYLHNRTRAGLAWHAVLSVLLLAANYMTFAAVSLAMAIDYIVWGRRRRTLRGLDWIILLAPQLLIGAILISIWNPLRIAAEESKAGSWLCWKSTLLWWNIRDLNAAEFGVGALLLAAPIVAIAMRSTWLLRAVIALIVSIVFVTLVSPQALSDTKLADVRYLSFLIPLCIVIGAMTLNTIPAMLWPLTIVIAIVAFGSNILHGTPFWNRDVKLRATPVKYAIELRRPVPDPYTPTAAWINQNLRDGESIYVMPQHMAYPLMFLAPKAIYAWQLSDPPPPGLERLPSIHYLKRIWPDYIIIFAPNFHRIEVQLAGYELAANIPVFGHDVYRPELFWRVFEPITNYGEGNQVFIARRIRPKVDFHL